MKYDVLLIGLSGFVGSITRYFVYLWFGSRNLASFPWATLFVNLTGCFLIGIVSLLVEREVPHHKQIFLMGSMGFLGAFTTFSAFGLETLALFKNQQVVLALANITANVVIGLLAVWLGRSLASGF